MREWAGARRRARMIAGAVASTAALAGACRKNPPPQTPPPPEVAVVQVEPRRVPTSFEFTGEVQPYRRVEVRARVDAIVLHPPDESVAPGMRTVLFPDEMQQLTGIWRGNVWPVVVSAYKQGEPIDAIPLDQLMLRVSEIQIVLWIPKDTEYQIRVFTPQGLIESRSQLLGNRLWVSIKQPEFAPSLGER